MPSQARPLRPVPAPEVPSPWRSASASFLFRDWLPIGWPPPLVPPPHAVCCGCARLRHEPSNAQATSITILCPKPVFEKYFTASDGYHSVCHDERVPIHFPPDPALQIRGGKGKRRVLVLTNLGKYLSLVLTLHSAQPGPSPPGNIWAEENQSRKHPGFWSW